MKPQLFVTAMVGVLVSASVALAQKSAAPSASELSEITARGRRLAAYDSAASHATDAVQELHPAEGIVRRYIAKQTISGWVVGFGRLNDAGDAFLLAYEATQAGGPQHFTVESLNPPTEDADFYFQAARAIDTALKDFEASAPKRRFNVAVLRAEADQLYVYIYPAQETKGVFVMGADARYLMSPDGSSIVEKRQMHKSIIERKMNLGDGRKVAAGVHGHVLSDLPEDSDVFYVLSRKPYIPEEVVTKDRKMYEIQADGTIVAKEF